jgi:hypothetical protein
MRKYRDFPSYEARKRRYRQLRDAGLHYLQAELYKSLKQETVDIICAEALKLDKSILGEQEFYYKVEEIACLAKQTTKNN